MDFQDGIDDDLRWIQFVKLCFQCQLSKAPNSASPPMFTHASQGRLNWAIQTLNTIPVQVLRKKTTKQQQTSRKSKAIPRRGGASIDPKGKAMVKLVVPRCRSESSGEAPELKMMSILSHQEDRILVILVTLHDDATDTNSKLRWCVTCWDVQHMLINGYRIEGNKSVCTALRSCTRKEGLNPFTWTCEIETCKEDA